jgi:1-acyl-sn-glycerol-3-phosphate acyltransferase
MWYWLFRSIFIGLLKVFFKFKVEGRGRIPAKVNFIVVANHASFLDPVVVGAAIPYRIYWMAARFLYGVPWLKWFLFKTGTHPVGGSSAKRFIDLLDKNKNVGLFPEGTCSLDGNLGEFKRGAALLALKTGRPIVPCAILGTFKALPKRAKFPKFIPLKVKIGEPIYLLKEFDELIDDIYLQEGMLKIKNTIKEMIDEG